jgi:DNA-binding CsgD family transcriptional regulator
MYPDRITTDSSVAGATGSRPPRHATRRHRSGTEPHKPVTVPDGEEPPPPPSEALSPREMDVLRQLPTELTAAEIGAVLFISANTVKAHMRSIYRKLGASRRHEAIVQAREQGLL